MYTFSYFNTLLIIGFKKNDFLIKLKNYITIDINYDNYSLNTIISFFFIYKL